MADETCSRCGSPAPRPLLACLDCVDGLDKNGDLNRTYYCTSVCQIFNIKAHAEVCADKNVHKQIYRAGEILQAIFYHFREAAFDIKIKKIEKRKGKLHMYEHYYKSNLGDSIHFRLPVHLLSDPKDKAAVLTYMTCNEASSFLWEISKEMLKDITTTIEEVTVTVPPQNRTIFKIDGRGISDSHRIFSHEVVSLTAKDDETYILDIAGAQHGQYRAIVPFDEYMASHASELTEVHPHGHQAASCQAYLAGKQEHNWMPDNYVGPPVDDRVWEVADEMRKRMLLVVREWEIERGTSVRELLKLDQKRFVARKKSLLKNIRREMEGFIERFEKAGCVFEKRGGLQTVGSGWSSDRDENSEMALENSSTEESNRGSRAVKRMEADKRARTFAAMPSHVRDLFKGLEGADSDIHVL